MVHDKATGDWVGPRDHDSNMRLIRFHVPPNETPLEKEYRLLREDTQKWHQEFWSNHNRNFFKVFPVLYQLFFIALALCQQEITAVLIFSILEAQIYQFSVYVHFLNLFLLYLKEKVLKCRLYLETVN